MDGQKLGEMHPASMTSSTHEALFQVFAMQQARLLVWSLAILEAFTQ